MTFTQVLQQFLDWDWCSRSQVSERCAREQEEQAQRCLDRMANIVPDDRDPPSNSLRHPTAPTPVDFDMTPIPDPSGVPETVRPQPIRDPEEKYTGPHGEFDEELLFEPGEFGKLSSVERSITWSAEKLRQLELQPQRQGRPRRLQPTDFSLDSH